jgi:hypothetical protein
MTQMLAKPYTHQPIAGWLLSEKLDGVRLLAFVAERNYE